MSHAKPEFTSSIAQVKSNESIPDTLLNKLVTENKAGFGFAIKNGDKLEVEKFPRLEEKDRLLTATSLLTNIMSNTKKYPVMFTFHEVASEEYDEDEIQPYTILKDSKGNPILTVCVEGDFPTYAGNEDGFSESYCLVNDWLGPKIEGMYKLLGNSPTKLVEYLRTEQFASDFNHVIGHRGCLAFMPAQGDQFIIEKNDIGLEGPWGCVSNAYGYTESAAAAATPEPAPAAPAPEAQPEKKKSKYSDAPAAPAAPKATVTPPKADKPVIKDPIEKVADQIVEEVEVEEEVDWSPPANVHGKGLKDLYRATAGFLPKDWKQRPKLKIKVKKKVRALAELAATAVGMAANGSKVEPKDMKHSAPTLVPSMPIISGDLQRKAAAHIEKHLGDGSAVIDDPTKTQAEEEALAKFSELILKSNNIKDVLRWPTSYIFAFSKENPEAFALGFIEIRSLLRRFFDLEKNGDRTLKDLVGSMLPKTTAEQVVIPSPQPGPTPAETLPVAPAPVALPEGRKKSKYA